MAEYRPDICKSDEEECEFVRLEEYQDNWHVDHEAEEEDVQDENPPAPRLNPSIIVRQDMTVILGIQLLSIEKRLAHSSTSNSFFPTIPSPYWYKIQTSMQKAKMLALGGRDPGSQPQFLR